MMTQTTLLDKIEELERRCPGTHIHRDVLDALMNGPISDFKVDVPTWSGRMQVVGIDLEGLGQTFDEWLDMEIPRWSDPSTDDDARYNVICPVHGKVQIGKRYYDIQMSRADDPWRCTVCGAASEFDDDSYEEYGEDDRCLIQG